MTDNKPGANLNWRHLKQIQKLFTTEAQRAQSLICTSRDPLWLITNLGQIWTDDTSNKFKNYSPQSHRGHREKHYIVNYATGAVNKVKLRVLCGEMLLSTGRRVRRAHRYYMHTGGYFGAHGAPYSHGFVITTMWWLLWVHRHCQVLLGVNDYIVRSSPDIYN